MSRLHPKKGADILIEAYGEMARQCERAEPLPDLVIAGPSPDVGYTEKLRKLATDLPTTVACRIHFAGMLSGDAKWGAFHGCEAFILPSHQENFGIVVAEAVACGKPVLVSDRVNIWHEVEMDGAGFVEPDSTEGVARLLQKWRALPAQNRNAMSQRARKCFGQRFEIGAAAESLVHALTAYGTNAANGEGIS